MQNSVKLHQLLSRVPVSIFPSGRAPIPKSDPTLHGIYLDSRQIEPGALFVAVTGGKFDGHDFIPDAIRRGAAAVAGTRNPGDIHADLKDCVYIRVIDDRQALAHFSAGFYGYPGGALNLIGVTGTDGKTTTGNLIYAALQAAGVPVGMISTVNARIGSEVLDTGFHVTTPEAPDVQRYLRQMVAANLDTVVLEATSHGLAQHRVTACGFDIGVVTNITHEHLDYHGSYEAYRDAKAELFVSLVNDAWKMRRNPPLAILNRDDASYDYLSNLVGSLSNTQGEMVRIISYGFNVRADVRALKLEHGSDGLRLMIAGPGWNGWITSPLIGEYNASNILAAVSTAVTGLGLEFDVVGQGIALMPSIPGRMERIDLGADFTAIVDFAHTPNALQRALLAAKDLAQHSSPSGRVIAVFGSAGLRDRQKRRMMAEISADLADISILTAEDPRSESLTAILEEMAEGARSRGSVEKRDFVRIPDRREAIRYAVSTACPGDIVIALGKGHEQSMCFGETEYPWDDREAMRAALSEHLGLDGPEMPYLPDPL